MDYSMTYCVGCLRKFCPPLHGLPGSRAYFFIPVLDALDRPFYAYIGMRQEVLLDIFSDGQPRSINLAQHAEILHVEEGYWPSEERQAEIRDFHRPLEDAGASAAHRYVPAPEAFECA